MSSLTRLKHRSIAALATAFPSLGERLADGYRPERSGDAVPWAPLRKPLPACTIALVTTAGVHHRHQEPFDMGDPDGDPTFREIDFERRLDSLTITHDYYDHRDADRDVNIVLPVERMRELAARGEIGGLAPRGFSFMGHVTGRHIPTLTGTSAPEVARQLARDRVDAVLLTPG